MNKFVYGLLSCCIMACGDMTEADKDEDPNISIVQKVFNEDPLAIDFIKKEKNEDVIDNLQQRIATYIKNQNTFISNEEKGCLARMLVHCITNSYTPQTPLTVEKILDKINEFDDTVNSYSKYVNKDLNDKKKIIVSYCIGSSIDKRELVQLDDVAFIEQLKKINISNDTPDVEIFNKIRAVFSLRT